MRKQVGQIDADLLARVDAEAERLGQTRVLYIERALSAALTTTVIGQGLAPYRQGYGPNVEPILSSSQAKRGVQQIPKAGKR